MSALIRTAAATLVLSAAGLIGMAVSEGWEPVARPPVPGDVPTGGFGSTRSESGPMKEGERIDPVRGLILLQSLGIFLTFSRAVLLEHAQLTTPEIREFDVNGIDQY